MIPGVSTDQEALLINLTRPIVLAQPMAFDKGMLQKFYKQKKVLCWMEDVRLNHLMKTKLTHKIV